MTPTAPSLALTDIRAEYERRRDAALALAGRVDGQSAVVGNLRVLLVVAWAVVAWQRWGDQPWVVHALLAAVAFASLVIQGRLDDRVAAARRRAAWHARNLDRLDGKWREFPSTGATLADGTHAYALDLDVVGKGSLFQLVDTTRTKQGEETLGRWLLAPAPEDALAVRIDSVKALAASLDDREALATPEADAAARIDERPLVHWGGSEPALVLSLPERLLSYILPPVTGTVLLLLQQGRVPAWPAIALLAVHVALLARHRAAVSRIAAFAERTERDLLRLLPLLEAAAALRVSTPRLDALKQSLHGAADETRALRRRVTVFQSRANLIVAFVSPILLWDLHAASLLQSWQRRVGASLGGWFEALGELEALAAFGTYAAEHPDDCWPVVAPPDAPLVAAQLGHPLLDGVKCVRNDVALEGPAHLLLVTGSNMSGKSTLLRAVGLNAVLALAGLPVRAASLRLPRRQVATAMRAVDSLQEGASLFLAEVRRLKSVVDVARGTPTLFLLDEILHGTNTRERSIGAKGVVKLLVDAGACGLVSTHDLSLTALGDDGTGRVAFAHFTDHVEGGRMTFDYVMRPGVVQTTNALRVLRANGLDVGPPDS